MVTVEIDGENRLAHVGTVPRLTETVGAQEIDRGASSRS